MNELALAVPSLLALMCLLVLLAIALATVLG